MAGGAGSGKASAHIAGGRTSPACCTCRPGTSAPREEGFARVKALRLHHLLMTMNRINSVMPIPVDVVKRDLHLSLHPSAER
ncbi:hypothetical protein M2341_002950 [Sphingobium sp. B7D2B]|nr:hypothetical protein [Sphingobium sp. B7D2B]MCW2410936.1 hypothetical protein [Sphingobium sp. B8D3D]MCW2416773.1 hypothetical protein [Sphingobium sp. B8D3A]